MKNYNKVVLVGRLTRDPELKYVLGGTPLSNYFIAVGRDYKNNEGIRETDFFKIVCWRKLAEFSKKYLKRGRAILVEGCLQTRTYEKEGQTHFMTEVIADKIEFMDSQNNFDNGSSLEPEQVRHTEENELNDIKFEEVPF